MGYKRDSETSQLESRHAGMLDAVSILHTKHLSCICLYREIDAGGQLVFNGQLKIGFRAKTISISMRETASGQSKIEHTTTAVWNPDGAPLLGESYEDAFDKFFAERANQHAKIEAIYEEITKGYTDIQLGTKRVMS